MSSLHIMLSRKHRNKVKALVISGKIKLYYEAGNKVYQFEIIIYREIFLQNP